MTTDTPLPKRDWKPLIFVLGFFLIWSGYVAFLYPLIEQLGVDTLGFALLHMGSKILIWIVPVFIYLHLVDGVNPFDYLKLRQHWKKGLLIGAVLSLVNFGIFFVQFGAPRLDSTHITWNSILNTSIAIGFIEEILFRGFILQKLIAVINFWAANLLTSLLFLLVHIIGWILLGSDQTLYLYGAILIFGFGMGIIFRYSNSLWSCILVHSLNDFFSVVLFTR